MDELYLSRRHLAVFTIVLFTFMGSGIWLFGPVSNELAYKIHSPQTLCRDHKCIATYSLVFGNTGGNSCERVSIDFPRYLSDSFAKKPGLLSTGISSRGFDTDHYDEVTTYSYGPVKRAQWLEFRFMLSFVSRDELLHPKLIPVTVHSSNCKVRWGNPRLIRLFRFYLTLLGL